MRGGMVRGIGLALAGGYAAFIGWLYVRQPQTTADVTGGLAASVGAYRVNRQAFDEGLQLFRRDQFAAARAAFERADPAQQDARTQFYIATFVLYFFGLILLPTADQTAAGGRDSRQGQLQRRALPARDLVDR